MFLDYVPVAALGIFFVTLILMITRPKNVNIGIAAGIGAIASFIFGTITIIDISYAFMNIWDAALAFIGIVTMSVTLDAMGFFRWAALNVAKLARGNGKRLYLYIALFTAIVSILFANDSAVLILTPIVMEIIICLDMEKDAKLAYLFAAGLVADTAAMPLITSNPVNIVSADFFHYTFIEHLIFMGPIAIVTIAMSIGIVFLYFRKKIPKTYRVELLDGLTRDGPIIAPIHLKISIITLILIDIGYVLASFNRIPVSFIICSGALFLFVVYIRTVKKEDIARHRRKAPTDIIKDVNWDIFFFMIGIFLVVLGLRHAGVVDIFANIFAVVLSFPFMLSTFGLSIVVTMGASFMNNWPMTMLGLLSIEEAIKTFNLDPRASTTLIFSNIIGNNLGPHFFPLGSLAILMWMGVMKRKGLTIGFKDYLKVGTVLSICEVFTASLMLWIEINVLNLVLTL